MNKWYGKIGFMEYAEEPENSGIYVEKITERFYYGDLIVDRNSSLEGTNVINSGINLKHKISVLADPFAIKKYYDIRYVEISGAKWMISSVELAYPRLILSTGGLYNHEC